MATQSLSFRLASTLTGGRTRGQVRRAFWVYAFATPWILGLLIFTVGPILASLYFGFTDYNIIKPAKWVGLANYQRALFKDDLFWPSMGRTFYFALVTVPLETIASLLCAMLLNQNLRGKSIFRTLFFLPSLTPAPALAILWAWILHPQMGPVNTMLGYLGLPKPLWMAAPATAIPSLILISLWAAAGGNRMLIFLAGLQGVPEELYDASRIDGAGRWATLSSVTLPMISPTILFNVVLGVIGALKVFTLAFVATKGGPAYATWFIALHIYSQAFQYFRMGYGAALAWLFAIMLLVFTVIQLKLSDRWVYYAGQ